MNRRTLLLIVCSTALARAADPARDAAAVITDLAAALTAGNVQEFMEPFDPAFADYQKVRTGVAALAAQGDTQSYIEVMKNQGDSRSRTLEVSWELRVLRQGDATISSRRQVQVTCKLELRGKRWRIAEFAPVDFLAP